MSTYGISFRMQRVTTEETYVEVMVTDDLIIETEEGGRLNVEAVVARAVELAWAPDAAWRVEERSIAPHPIQQAPPESEEVSGG